MNIIKLKDVVMPDNYRLSEFFNKNLKGKYAYWVKMRYIFPLDSLDYKTYIQYEQLDNVYMLGANILPHIDLYSEECNMYNFASEYIDHDETELINSMTSYVIANKYVADADIDINKLRRFRSWLAEEILNFNIDLDGNYMNMFTADEVHMLEYYKNGMYNDIVKQLSIFGKDNAFTMTTASGCNCCGNAISLYGTSVMSSCDALQIYVKNMHDFMVRTFEDVNFWLKFNKDFITVFKRYIDNIINTGMTINIEAKPNVYVVCNCDTSSSNGVVEALKRLSKALQYIIDNNVTGHVNFIYDSLHTWAEQLYDHMSWEIK